MDLLVSEIVLLGISCLVVLANGFVCGLVLTRKKLRTYTNGFVVSLAVSDILSGGVFLPISVLIPNSRINGHVAMLVIASSTLNLSAVAFERYLAVVRPLAYRITIQNSFLRLVCAVWCVATLMSILPVIWEAQDNLLVHKIYLSSAVVLFLVLPLIFVFFVYIYIFMRLRRHGRILCSMQATRTRLDEARKSRRESKTVKMFFTIVTVFSACWIPVIYMTFAVVAERLDLVPVNLLIVSHFSIMLSSLVNPFLYTFMKQDFSQVVARLFLCKLLRRGTGESREITGSLVLYTKSPYGRSDESYSGDQV